MTVLELIHRLSEMDPNHSVVADDFALLCVDEMFWSEDQDCAIDLEDATPTMDGERIVSIKLYR